MPPQISSGRKGKNFFTYDAIKRCCRALGTPTTGPQYEECLSAWLFLTQDLINAAQFSVPVVRTFFNSIVTMLRVLPIPDALKEQLLGLLQKSLKEGKPVDLPEKQPTSRRTDQDLSKPDEPPAEEEEPRERKPGPPPVPFPEDDEDIPFEDRFKVEP